MYVCVYVCYHTHSLTGCFNAPRRRGNIYERSTPLCKTQLRILEYNILVFHCYAVVIMPFRILRVPPIALPRPTRIHKYTAAEKLDVQLGKLLACNCCCRHFLTSTFWIVRSLRRAHTPHPLLHIALNLYRREWATALRQAIIIIRSYNKCEANQRT